MMFATMVAGDAAAQEKPSAWPWDFPMNMEINVEAGQKALSCQMHYFQTVKKGDKVRVIDLDEYAPDYIVEQVDLEHGHVWVKHEKGTRVHCHGILDVTKVLDK